jgi:L-ascorbate metabolism protein UlaG (beta-lactamase superfamily)
MTQGQAKLRWCGAGIVELATPDYRDMLFIDSCFWSNTGWERFGVAKPPEYSSLDGFVSYVQAKRPENVLIAVTHDHNDHLQDYFEVLTGLVDAGVNVQSVIQADLGRIGLKQRYIDAGLDREEVVVWGGRGCNIGGKASMGGMTTWMVPAIHSTFLGYPSVGYVVEVGGVRLYCSGDTDLFGDMALIGRRYRPHVAVVCISNGRVTMGPDDAVDAVEMVGAQTAIPIHYAHNPFVRQPDAGPEFEKLMASAQPAVRVHVPNPGDALDLHVS